MRTKRDLHVEALHALLHNGIVAAGKARDWELLEEIACIAQDDAPTDLAATDPSLYVALRNAITQFHLKGWTRMTPERVRLVAERHRHRSAP